MYKKELNKIANTIFINAQYLENLGLFDGQIGVAIFLYNYADYTDNITYRKLADELINHIHVNLNWSVGVNFFDGLSGIAYGIDYIVKNKFVEVDEDILKELDLIMSKINEKTFLSELRSDLPVFSKGLYFLQRRDKYSLSKIAEECTLFLEAYKEDIPLSYINSILYFINKASLLEEIEEQTVNKISRILQQCTSRIFSKQIYDELDLYILRKNIEHVSEQQRKAEWLELLSDYCCTDIHLIDKSWSNFFYRYNDGDIVEKSNIKKHLEDLGQILVYEEPILYRGLAGLGLELIRISKLN